MTNLGLRISLPLSLTVPDRELSYGDSAEVELDSVLKHGLIGARESGVAGNISLRLIFLNKDADGVPVFMCDRLPEFTITSFNATRRHACLTRIFLCGIDHEPVATNGDNVVFKHVAKLDDKTVCKQGSTFIHPFYHHDDFVTGVLDVISNEVEGLSPLEYIDEMRLSDTGVDSLTWIIIVSRIRKETNVDIGIASLYTYPTFGKFKEYLRNLIRPPLKLHAEAHKDFRRNRELALAAETEHMTQRDRDRRICMFCNLGLPYMYTNS
jgi:acyl carrier protein